MSFVPGWFTPQLMATAGRKPSVALTATNMATSTSSSNNFGSQSIGVADPSRIMVLLLQAGFVTSGTYGNVTLGGTNMNLRSSSGATSRVYTLPIASGTSAGLIVNAASGSFLYCDWSLWALYDLLAEAPTDQNVTNFANPASVTLSCLQDAVVVAQSSGLASIGDISWSGVSEVFEFTGGSAGNNRLGGGAASLVPAGSRNVVASAGSGHSVFAASFR